MLSSIWRSLLRPRAVAAQIPNATGTTPSRVKFASLDAHKRVPKTNRSVSTVAAVPVLTFRPDKFTSAGQGILDLSHKWHVGFNVKEPTGLLGNALPVTYRYVTKGKTLLRFPSGTRGMLYFHQVPENSTESQIRFRLCETVADFQGGKDLLLPNGTPWGITFRRLQQRPSAHAAFLNLLRAEYSLTVDPDVAANRIISTLIPHKQPARDQRVFDISGLCAAFFHFPGQFKSIYIKYGHVGTKLDRFPLNTTGLFYYMQSVTAPSQIGELRFRLCADAASFEQGKDLCLPSGGIWNINSNTIRTAAAYQQLKEFLVADGLLDDDLGTGYGGSETRPLLYSISQPFEVDFSDVHLHFAVVGPNMTTHECKTSCFRNPQLLTTPLYQGRAIVRFEPYPPIAGATSSKHKPLLALRVLELLTPVTRLSEDSYMLIPAPGELVTANYYRKGVYVPWGFRPRNPLVKNAIMEMLPPPVA